VRKELGQALSEYGSQNQDVVVLDADVSSSTMTRLFQQAHPERFFNVGIAEAGMVDTAVGLALGGKIPFASAFASLLCYRALEQIRTCVAYNNVNVKLLGGYAGVSDFKDGPTHHSLFDLAVMRAMPNMTVVVPADGPELKALVPEVAEYRGPVYMRISRAELPRVFGEKDKPRIGTGRVLEEGRDLTLAATGIVLHRALEARRILGRKGLSARVVEFHTLKPFDEALACRCAQDTGALVTVEEHNVIGGLYGAVCEALGRRIPVPVLPVGIQDRYMCTAPDPESLWDYCGLRPEDIASKAEELMLLKR
jgi:transketolase